MTQALEAGMGAAATEVANQHAAQMEQAKCDWLAETCQHIQTALTTAEAAAQAMLQSAHDQLNTQTVIILQGLGFTRQHPNGDDCLGFTHQ